MCARTPVRRRDAVESRFVDLFQDGFAQPDDENDDADFDHGNGLPVGNENGSPAVGADDETY